MFVVSTQDGDQLIEGDNVSNWGAVPKDKNILSVTLTDGNAIKETLSGFEFYLVCYEAEMVAHCSAEGGKIIATGNPAPRVIAQHLFGVRAHRLAKQTVNRVGNRLLTDMQDAFARATEGENILLVYARRQGLTRIKERMAELLKGYQAQEVVHVSLSLGKRSLPRSEFKHAQDGLREGVPVQPDHTDERATEDYLCQ